MGLIVKTEQEYDSIRGALGLDFDVKRQLTDDVIDELMFLPAAEAEAISRVTQSNFPIIMALPPNDPSLLSFKAGTMALCCANLCPRLQVTIPTSQKIEDLAAVERNKIDWRQKRDQYRGDANYFFANMAPIYYANAFPVALAGARGRVLRHDPDFHRVTPNQTVSNFTGFTSPSGAFFALSLV